MTIDITINVIVRVLLAFIFLRAVWHKAADVPHFMAQLGSYQLLPEPLLPAVAFLLLVIEGLLALTLLIPGWPYPLWLAAALLLLYAVALGVNLIRGMDDLDCGCGGSSAYPQAISWSLVMRNIVLAILTLATALLTTTRDMAWQDFSTIGPAGIALIVLYSSMEQAIINQQRQRLHARPTQAIYDGKTQS